MKSLFLNPLYLPLCSDDQKARHFFSSCIVMSLVSLYDLLSFFCVQYTSNFRGTITDSTEYFVRKCEGSEYIYFSQAAAVGGTPTPHPPQAPFLNTPLDSQ